MNKYGDGVSDIRLSLLSRSADGNHTKTAKKIKEKHAELCSFLCVFGGIHWNSHASIHRGDPKMSVNDVGHVSILITFPFVMKMLIIASLDNGRAGWKSREHVTARCLHSNSAP